MIARVAAPRFRWGRPCAGRDGVAQHLFERPHMVGQPRRHRRCPFQPCAAPAGAQAQALVGPADVVGSQQLFKENPR